MTGVEIVEGLKLLEDNMVHFDELQNDKGEWIDVHELLFEAIQALEQQPCDTYTEGYFKGYDDGLEQKLEEHPVTQKYGKWIYQKGYVPYKWKCNQCSAVFKTDFLNCPNCGCRMVDSQESEGV